MAALQETKDQPSTFGSYDTLCKEIDGVLMEHMSAMQECVDKKLELQVLCSRGHLNLSRARYSMGNKSVGLLQYPETMIATFTAPLIPDPQPSVESIGALSDLSLRKRKNDAEPSEDVAEGSQRGRDPLHWFGVLVPPPLRAAQTEFSRALALVLDISATQRTLQLLQERHSQLMRLKSDYKLNAQTRD